ncbi:MAG: Flp family type IVb pilin [Candidatus Deferrimicrobiaceae bacterium]
MKKTGKIASSRSGQGLTEYIIIVALVAIAAIGVVNIFGNQLRHQFSTIIASMSGSSVQVTSLAEKAKQQANQRTLKDYASENR